MKRFFARNSEPVPIEVIWHAVETPSGVEGQIDGVEFNVANGMDQRCTAFGREGRSLFNCSRGDSLRTLWTPRYILIVFRLTNGVRQEIVIGVHSGSVRCCNFVFGIRHSQGGESAQSGMHPYNSSFDVWRHDDGPV